MKKERYPYINNPYGFKLPEENPVIHPVIIKWEDFTEKDKTILQNIKKKIVSIIGDCKVSIFGSRVKGNWTDKSDYDILVHKTLSDETLSILKSIDYEIKIDLSFCSDDPPPIENSINII